MKQEMYVHIWKWEKDKEVKEYILHEEEATSSSFILLGKTTVTFDLPPMPSDDELTNREIAFLQKGREEVTKEFATKLANIDEQLEKLRALPAPCMETDDVG